jgi:lipopolysaccharide export system permease protein
MNRRIAVPGANVHGSRARGGAQHMKLSSTLSAYVARHFLAWFGIMMGGLVAIVLLFDMLEQLRRAATREQATTSVVVTMALLRLPTLAQLLVTFAVLFGAMFAFWRLTRTHELVVTRSAGVSVWQFLAPAVATALCIGIVQVTLFNPFAAVLLGRSERLEAAYFSNRSSTSGLFPSGLWLRQADGTGHTVIHAQRVIPEASKLENVIVFRFAEGDRFVSRIDAATAVLASGRWELRDARITTPQDPAAQHAVGTVATDLTWEQIEDSFAPPETMSFWELPAFIAMMESAGFSALRHRLHFHKLLASPLLLCAMVLIAAAFTLRPGRRGTGGFIAAGLATGFGLYIASDFVFAFGLSGRIPVELAAWTPSAVCLLIGSTMLLHVEER